MEQILPLFAMILLETLLTNHGTLDGLRLDASNCQDAYADWSHHHVGHCISEHNDNSSSRYEPVRTWLFITQPLYSTRPMIVVSKHNCRSLASAHRPLSAQWTSQYLQICAIRPSFVYAQEIGKCLHVGANSGSTIRKLHHRAAAA